MEPDCLRRLANLTSEEGFDDETERDELVNTAREVLAYARELRAIIEGRTTPPTIAEIAAHPGEWIVDGASVGLYFSDDHDTRLRLKASTEPHALDDTAARAWLAEKAREGCQWIAIDSDGKPCAWPVVSP